MKIAVMQPYLLPYVGYLQLIAAVDVFVSFDDVNYIKKGWINRNRCLYQGRVHDFTLPMRKASQNRSIRDTAISEPERAKDDLWRLLADAYRRAPFFAAEADELESLVCAPGDSIAEYNAHVLKGLARLAGLNTRFVDASTLAPPEPLRGQARILDICERLGGTTYVNPPGGVDLYESAEFTSRSIDLRFLKPALKPYPQGAGEFVPGLSVADAVFNVGRQGFSELLSGFATVPKTELQNDSRTYSSTDLNP